MIIINNSKDFLKSFKSYVLFEIKNAPLSDKEKFISELSEALNFPPYVSNWDGVIDEMRGLYSVGPEKIIVIVHTDPEKNKFLNDLSEVVDTVNEFLRDFHKEAILVVSVKE